MPGKGKEIGFMTPLEQLSRIPWPHSQQVSGEDSSSRPRSLFPKNVGSACLHKQLYLRNRKFNWLKPTVWNLEWKLGSPPPQHLYFWLWSFGRTAGSINWLLAVYCIIHLCTHTHTKKKLKKHTTLPGSHVNVGSTARMKGSCWLVKYKDLLYIFVMKGRVVVFCHLWEVCHQWQFYYPSV